MWGLQNIIRSMVIGVLKENGNSYIKHVQAKAECSLL